MKENLSLYDISNKENLSLYDISNKEIIICNFINDLYEKYKLSNLLNVKFIDIISYTQLPSYFLLEEYNINKIPNNKNNKKIIFHENTYIHNGISFHDIICANINIPYYKESFIPFTFPYTYNNKSYLINSNVYYYEITVDTNIICDEWPDMNISIGYGSELITLQNIILGFDKHSIGYSSYGNIINGSIIKDSYKDISFKKYGKGDTIGAGVIYESSSYKIFFTLNGKLCKKMVLFPLDIKLIPMIAINYNALISVNFSNKPFKYNFINHISSNIISFNKII